MSGTINMELADKQIVLYPNFIKIDLGFPRNRFHNCYCYIDTQSYSIDKILIEKEIPVKWLNTEYAKEDNNLTYCFLQCRKKYSEVITKEVFPQLHKELISTQGQVYIDECEMLQDAILVGINNQIAREKEETDGQKE